jgi:predicted enzyme related to lactoylglutathione lyase
MTGSLVVAALVGCGGKDEDRAAGIIHRLLLAGQLQGFGTLESFAGRLPDDLPAEPPLYPGADLIVSSRQPAPSDALDLPPELGGPPPGADEAVLYFIVLDTDDDRTQVFSFYEEALDEDGWRLGASASTEALDTLEFEQVNDADINGVVTIARGKEDDRTSILISLQDAGALALEEPPFEPGESVPVPKAFPPDVPIYEGAIITSSAFFPSLATETFLLTFLTTDSQDDVIAFYRGAFEERGWTVEQGSAIGLADTIDFRDAGRTIEGQLSADRSSRDRRYTLVVIQLRVDSARQPPDDEEQAGSTRAEAHVGPW